MTNEAADLTQIPEHLVGSWRRFGPTGPVYQIIKLEARTMAVDRTARIKIVETGEEMDYRLSRLLDDPEAR